MTLETAVTKTMSPQGQFSSCSEAFERLTWSSPACSQSQEWIWRCERDCLDAVLLWESLSLIHKWAKWTAAARLCLRAERREGQGASCLANYPRSNSPVAPCAETLLQYMPPATSWRDDLWLTKWRDDGSGCSTCCVCVIDTIGLLLKHWITMY